MAARIEQFDIQQGIKQAWHKLTQIVEGLSLSNNWLRTWEIVQVPLWLRGSDLQKMLPGQIITENIRTVYSQMVASDNANCLIGKPFADTYRPLTNAEFLGFLEKALEGTQHQLESIGTVRNRGRRFASFNISKLAEYTAGGRTFKSYLNAGDALDQSSQVWWNTSNTATVCDNTYAMNLGERSTQRTKHTKNVMVRVNDFSAKIEEAVGVHAEFAAAFESLASQPVSKTDARSIYAGFIGGADGFGCTPRVEKLSTRAIGTIDDLSALFVRGRGNRGESKADLFSAVTDFYTHNSVSGRINRALRQFDSSEFGTGAQRKDDFWNLVNDGDRLATVEAVGAQLLKVS